MNPSNPARAREPDGVRPNGRLHLILVLAGVMAIAVLAIASSASAETWETPLNMSEDMILEVQDIATDGDQVFVLAKGRPYYAIGLALKWYDGESWRPWMAIGDMPGWTGWSLASIDADDGKAHLVWVDNRRGFGFYDLYYTTFENGTFGAHEKIETEGEWDEWPYKPRIIVDGEVVHIGWREITFDDTRMNLRKFNGTAWEDEVAIYVEDSQFIWDLDFDIDGDTFHFVWKTMNYTDDDYDIMYRSWNGTTWTMPMFISRDLAQEEQEMPRIIAFDGAAHVVWTETGDGDSDLRYRKHEDGRWGPISDLVPGAAGGQTYASLAREGPYMFLTWRDDRDGRGSTYFKWHDGTAWRDEFDLGTIGPGGHRWSEVAVSRGTVHVIWHTWIPDGTWLYYTRALFDEAPPAATLAPRLDTWLDGRGSDVAWNASDDYMLDKVLLRYRHSPDSVIWSDWEAFSVIEDLGTTFVEGMETFVPPAGDGFYQLQAVAVDSGGRWELDMDLAEAYGILDTTPPTGTITVNGGDEFTTSIDVTLDLTRADAITDLLVTVPEEWLYKMRISNDGVWNDEEWVEAVSPVDWTLEPVDGPNMVYYQVMDRSGLVSATFSDDIVLDSQAPTGMVSIEEDAPWTTSRDVVLSLAFVDAVSGVAEMRLGTDGVWDDEEWLAPVETMNWTLTEGDGEKTVYLQIRDAACLLSEALSDEIQLDTTAPGCQVSIDGGAEYTGSTTVTLTISFFDDTTGVEAMRLSSVDVFDSVDWMAPADSYIWTLEDGSGTRTVYLQVRDMAGHYSSIIADDIVLDNDDPTCTLAINGGENGTILPMVDLTIGFDDPTSYVTEMRINDGGSWEGVPWIPAHSSTVYTFSEGDGERTLQVIVRDVVGRESEIASATIVLDTTPPTVLSTYPTNGSIGVETKVEIVIQWSESMDWRSMTSFTLWQDGVEVPGRYAVDAANGTVVFYPDTPLEMGQECKLMIHTEARDVWGNAMVEAYATTFETELPVTEGPQTTSIWYWVIVAVLTAFIVAFMLMRTRPGPRTPSEDEES